MNFLTAITLEATFQLWRKQPAFRRIGRRAFLTINGWRV